MLKGHSSPVTEAQMGTAGIGREKEMWPFATGQPASLTNIRCLQDLHVLGAGMGCTGVALGNLQHEVSWEEHVYLCSVILLCSSLSSLSLSGKPA